MAVSVGGKGWAPCCLCHACPDAANPGPATNTASASAHGIHEHPQKYHSQPCICVYITPPTLPRSYCDAMRRSKAVGGAAGGFCAPDVSALDEAVSYLSSSAEYTVALAQGPTKAGG